MPNRDGKPGAVPPGNQGLVIFDGRNVLDPVVAQGHGIEVISVGYPAAVQSIFTGQK